MATAILPQLQDFFHGLVRSRHISESLSINLLVLSYYSNYLLGMNCRIEFFFEKSFLLFLRATFRCCSAAYRSIWLDVPWDSAYLSYLPCVDIWLTFSFANIHTTDTLELFIFLSLKSKQDYCLKLNHDNICQLTANY